MLFIAILMKQQKADFNFSRKIQKLYFCSTHWAKITKAVLDHRKNCKNQKCRALPLAQYAEAGARARDICTWAARSRPAVSATHTKLHGTLLPKIEKFIDFARAGSRTETKWRLGRCEWSVRRRALGRSVGRPTSRWFSQTFKWGHSCARSPLREPPQNASYRVHTLLIARTQPSARM